ncbi:MAG: reverse transcriptase-like protein [Acidobacteria bacterium]|nr:MAG: reverse transcriptase-like protein [Acidobacteriota bacterium]MCE7957035.1 hypothetical protein [Acidobacteria bacterium ACB2]
MLGLPREAPPPAPLRPSDVPRGGPLRELQADPLLGPEGGGLSRPFVVFFDGASRGNPGPAAYGVWSPSGVRIGRPIGRGTNNEAEWRGLLAALEAAREAGAEEVEVRADSELVVHQFNGVYRVKAENLRPFLAAARERARAFRKLTVVHVPRAQNHQADAVANEALDRNAPVGP